MSQSEKKIRVLVACPTLGLNPNPLEWLQSLQVIQNGIRRYGFDQALLCPYRQTWWPGNNQIWNIAFEQKFDYILRIDDDIHQVPDDGFSKLCEAKKDVIGAAYPNRRWPFFPAAMNRTLPDSLIDICLKDKRCLQYVQPEQGGEEIIPVDIVGFGMILIRVEAFKYFERPIYKGSENVPDDTYFAQLCLNSKIQQFVHFGVKLAHAHVTFDNYGHLFNAGVLQKQRHAQEEAKRIDGLKSEKTS